MYKKEYKFKVNIEGEERHCKDTSDTIDFVTDKTYFEVDKEALSADLKHLNKYETIELRYDCVILCIA